MITENLSTLKIHKISQAQYERELEAGRIDGNALYLTPDDNSEMLEDVVYAAEESVDTSAEVINADTLGGYSSSDFRHSDWLPTAEEVGAAPSGFGLGTTPKFITDANDAILPGFYAPNGVSCANIPSEWQFLYGTIIVSIGASFIEQLFLASNLMAKRTCDMMSSVWGEWEYINPPMLPGVEYRTTERHDGNPVYVKRVIIESIPTGTVAILTNNATSLVRSESKIEGVSGLNEICLPFVYGSLDSTYNAYAYVYREASGNIRCNFVCGANINGTAIVTIWYTK